MPSVKVGGTIIESDQDDSLGTKAPSEVGHKKLKEVIALDSSCDDDSCVSIESVSIL